MTNKKFYLGGGWYWLFVALYVFGIIYKSSFPIMSGDDASFYMQLFSGETAWHGLGISNGRFFPLAGWNLNLVALFSTNPYAFMMGNALVFFGIAWCFYLLASSLQVKPFFILFAFILASLSVGMVKIITQLAFPEITQILFLLLFLLCLKKLLESASTQTNPYLWLYGILALIFGNACIYLKEVSFIFVGGAGFSIFILSLYARQKLPYITKFFLVAFIISAVIFLVLYVYFTSQATSNYSQMEVFSPLRSLVVLILATPLIAFALPFMLIFRIYRIIKYKDEVVLFWDSVLLIAAAYVCAYLVLGMASFHYFMPPNVLICLYLLFFVKLYGKILKNLISIKLGIALIGFIFLSNIFPQSLHYFTLNKIANKNFNDAMSFIATKAKNSPNDINVNFAGFVEGAYSQWAYETFYAILPKLYHTQNIAITQQPQKGDLIVVSFLADGFKEGEIEKLLSENIILFKSENLGYFPHFNLMSLGAYGLEKLGIKHPLSNKGNVFKLPAQVYVLEKS